MPSESDKWIGEKKKKKCAEENINIYIDFVAQSVCVLRSFDVQNE